MRSKIFQRFKKNASATILTDVADFNKAIQLSAPLDLR